MRRLLDRVRRARPELDVRESYVDVVDPSVTDVVATLAGPAVLVPVLLSTGYHVSVDLPRVAAAAAAPATVAAPLGPDPVLVALACRRVREVAGEAYDALVLAAAGSSDPAAARAVEQAGAALSELTGRPVRPGYASAAQPRVAEAVDQLRRDGYPRVVVCRYLLAPGYFADRVGADAARAGAAAISEALGDDPELATLVLRRYDSVAGDVAGDVANLG